jgi:hypothetical protein
MIIEAIADTTLQGKEYKKGQQKNVLNSFGKFLIEKNGNWKEIKGQGQTKQESDFFNELETSEEKNITSKTKKS